MPLVALTIVIVIASLGAVAQLARRRLARSAPALGRLVDIGGHRLHVDVRGEGPAVVLEAGTWGPGIAWGPVRDQLTDVATVVTYDRAGLGWSDPSPRPRTPVVMAEELHELLLRAGVPGPYLLVGHSFGGVVVRVFAHRYPADVVGLVLVDAAHETQFDRFPEPLGQMNDRMARLMPAALAVLRLLVAGGLVALRPSLVPSPSPALPAEIVALIRARVASHAPVVATMARELRDLAAGYADVEALRLDSLGDLPVRVLSHGRPEGVPPQLGADVAAAYERTWQALQAEQAALSSRGTRVVAEGIGHDIPAEAPGLVAEAVVAVLEEGRRRAVA